MPRGKFGNAAVRLDFAGAGSHDRLGMRTEALPPALDAPSRHDDAGSDAGPDPAARAAFDRLSARYDALCENPVFASMRRDVHARLLGRFPPGSRLLEIGCGTGIDSAFLAARGIEVVACDPAPGMVDRAEARLRATGEWRGRFLRCGLEELDERLGSNEPSFDGILSDFGALNCVPNLGALRRIADRRLDRGGTLVLCLMNAVCLGEILYFLARGRPKDAFRRLRPANRGASAFPAGSIPVLVEGIEVPTYFHRSRAIERALGPGYATVERRGLAVFVPPFLNDGWRKLPGHFRSATQRLESRLAPHFPWNRFGDHFLIEIVKR